MNDKMKNLGEKMNVQNNRCTQYPLFIVVEDKKIYGVGDGWSDGSERVPEPEFDDLCESCQKADEDGVCLPEECDNCDDNTFVSYRIERDVPNLRSGVFFTAEACEQHIKENDYHYNSTVKSYGIGAWRNPEMVGVLQFLSKLGAGDNEIPSFYK